MDKLLESGLNRLNQHLENGEAMAIVSAFRSDNSLSTNRENTEKLRKLALTAGFGYVKVVGGYVEEVDGKKIPVEEDSTGYLLKVKLSGLLHEMILQLEKSTQD